MRTTLAALALGAALAACGGHKAASTTPGGGTSDDGGGDDGSSDDGGDMISPDVMDGITQALDRRRNTVARCLADAIVDGTAPKNTRGQIALEFVVTPGGTAKDVKVTRSTIKSEAVEKCVVEKVEQTSFPEPPRNVDWSYTYALDSN